MAQGGKAFPPIAGLEHVIACSFKHSLECHTEYVVVINHENAGHSFP
jgi:hypothetical protein